MDCDTAGEGVVDGGVLHVRWRVVASLLIHISSHMEMNWVMPHCLLAHVFQFQTFNVGSLKTKTNLENTRTAVKKHKSLLRAKRGNRGNSKGCTVSVSVYGGQGDQSFPHCCHINCRRKAIYIYHFPWNSASWVQIKLPGLSTTRI